MSLVEKLPGRTPAEAPKDRHAELDVEANDAGRLTGREPGGSHPGASAEAQASDIHLEPQQAGLQLRLRQDGVLQSQLNKLPKS